MTQEGEANPSAAQSDPEAAFAGRVDSERAPFALPTVAASAPVLVQLASQMREVRARTDDPHLREVLDGVLNGRRPLSALLADRVLPDPPEEMPDQVRELRELGELRETNGDARR